MPIEIDTKQQSEIANPQSAIDLPQTTRNPETGKLEAGTEPENNVGADRIRPESEIELKE